MKTSVRKLGDLLVPVPSVSPAISFGARDFTYVDISSVDRESKRIREPQIIPALDAPSRARQVLAQGDVIVSTVRPNLNTVAAVEGAFSGAIASTGFCVLRADPSLLNSRFLFHWVSSDQTLARLVNLATGATYPAVSDKIIKSLALQLPSLDGQKRIAAILDKANSLRHKRLEAIGLANDFLRAFFIDIFGDPVLNPKGWPTTQLASVCAVATGATPSREVDAYFEGPHPWIKTGEVDCDWIECSEEAISDRAIAETNCKLFPPKTVLVAMYGQGKTRGKVGMLAIPAATNQACAAILPSSDMAPEFLLCHLRLMYEHLRGMGRGGNQENLNLGMIKSLVVMQPPRDLVNRFVSVRRSVLAMRSKAVDGLTATEALASSLAQQYFQ